jgi:hypothetical protein
LDERVAASGWQLPDPLIYAGMLTMHALGWSASTLFHKLAESLIAHMFVSSLA